MENIRARETGNSRPGAVRAVTMESGHDAALSSRRSGLRLTIPPGICLFGSGPSGPSQRGSRVDHSARSHPGPPFFPHARSRSPSRRKTGVERHGRVAHRRRIGQRGKTMRWSSRLARSVDVTAHATNRQGASIRGIGARPTAQGGAARVMQGCTDGLAPQGGLDARSSPRVSLGGGDADRRAAEPLNADVRFA
jgi:hypothetical protein